MIVRLFIFCYLITFVLTNDELLVETNSGKVHGKFLDIISGKSIKAFLGIPYAEPPIDDLRFKPPIPITKWEGIKETTEVHSVCPQMNIILKSQDLIGDENCLFLNVYAPKRTEIKKLPVMVWIHGGAFFLGSGNTDSYGPDLLMEKGNIILVTVNYRLGALGFFSTGDDVVYGNNGLKDQTLALKWVKENIANFGGDEDNITIFGESAGGASVTFHYLSPLSKGLFHAGIAQSGSFLNPWALTTQEQLTGISKKLANLLNCPTDCTKKMVECLQKVNTDDIIKTQFSLFEWEMEPLIYFAPVIEDKHPNAFLNDDPREIIKSGKSYDVPFVSGVTSHEGCIRLLNFIMNPDTLKDFDENFDKLMKLSVFVNNTISNEKEVYKGLKDFYLKGLDMQTADKMDILNMYSDAWFTDGVDETVSLFRQHHKSNVYNYLFAYDGKHGYLKQFLPGENYGVSHADDLIYLFVLDMVQIDYKNLIESDKKMIETLTSLWTSFAKNKRPFAPKIDWKSVKSEDNEYLYISEKIKMKSKMFKDRLKFWKKLRKYTYKKDEL